MLVPEQPFLPPVNAALSLRNLSRIVFAAGRLWKYLEHLEQDLSRLRVALDSNTVSELLICLKRNELCFLLQNSYENRC